MRSWICKLTTWGTHHLCSTFGDVSEMHKGPCSRCIGHGLSSPPVGIKEED